MTTTQRPTAALFEVTELRQALLVLADAPTVAGEGGTLVPSSMLITYRQVTGGSWQTADITLIGHTLQRPSTSARLPLHAAGAFGPAWCRDLAAEHLPPRP